MRRLIAEAGLVGLRDPRSGLIERKILPGGPPDRNEALSSCIIAVARAPCRTERITANNEVPATGSGDWHNRSSAFGMPVGHDVSCQKVGRRGVGRGSVARTNITPPQHRQR